jgi:D-serine deaminase-like pyridoxal phosphate-dependent protein
MQALLLNAKDYAIDGAELLPTPRLAVYRLRLEQNIALMRGYLEGVVPGTGFRHLRPHAKTHKSVWTAQVLLASGIDKFKCTPWEIEFLIEAGARDIFVAYPLLAHDADAVARTAALERGIRLTAQIARLEHAERLAAAARRHGVEIDCLIDLDAGNRRTGIPPEEAPDLVRRLARSPAAGPLRVRGLHAYTGHNRSPTAAEREACSREAMGRVVECARGLERAGCRVERVVTSGTPGFLSDLRELTERHRLDAEVEVSPGTWVYWDTGYDRILPGMFEFAALVVTQVIDLPGDRLVTLNAGHKRWAIDQGPVELFSVPGLEFVGASEEHTVLRQTGGSDLAIGDPVLIAPRHVCPTVNAWENFTVVREDGSVEAAVVPVSGRNR